MIDKKLDLLLEQMRRIEEKIECDAWKQKVTLKTDISLQIASIKKHICYHSSSPRQAGVAVKV